MPASSLQTKKGVPRRRKVSKACLFCRRSHMTCDSDRPCARCVRRDIGHLCQDDEAPRPPKQQQHQPQHSQQQVQLPQQPQPQLSQQQSQPQQQPLQQQVQQQQQPIQPLNRVLSPTPPKPSHEQPSSQSVPPPPIISQPPSQPPLHSSLYANAFKNISVGSSLALPPFEDIPSFTANNGGNNNSSNTNGGNAGGGNSVGGGNNTVNDPFGGLGLNDFLKSFDFLDNDSSTSTSPVGTIFGSVPPLPANQLPQQQQQSQNQTTTNNASSSSSTDKKKENAENKDVIITEAAPPKDKTERYFMTAADQTDASRDERLARVIQAKYEAGLLQPHDYVQGYTRLMHWMERNMSYNSRMRTLKVISKFRPVFRDIASSLTDLDLIFIEEAFERLLLDYDRVLTAMGVPACIWRRTGQIYKGNKEFADLVGVPPEYLKDGRLAIYELMAEESTVNYWAKYGSIAFDPGQKAVLTSCVLVNQSKLSAARARHARRNSIAIPGANSNTTSSNNNAGQIVPSLPLSEDASLRAEEEAACTDCTFSFTIRRDCYNIPTMIVGNFLPY